MFKNSESRRELSKRTHLIKFQTKKQKTLAEDENTASNMKQFLAFLFSYVIAKGILLDEINPDKFQSSIIFSMI